MKLSELKPLCIIKYCKSFEHIVIKYNCYIFGILCFPRNYHLVSTPNLCCLFISIGSEVVLRCNENAPFKRLLLIIPMIKCK